MNKEDYMRLPKERLAELLAEKDAEKKISPWFPIVTPTQNPDCFHGGPCTNPHHDCINCPHLDGSTDFVTYTTTNTSTKANE